MNKVYKVIWNRTKQCYIVVSEFAKQAGKVKSTHLFAAMGKTTAAVGLGAALLFPLGGMNASAATGGQVIGGGGSDSGDTSQATGQDATVSGGFVNHAEGKYSSVSGGSKNHATGENSSISGGGDGIASGLNSSISGGKQNKATGEFSSVSGGDQNEAAGNQSTISGGTANKTTGDWSTIVGGAYNLASGNSSLALGGMMSAVQGMYSVGIAGGSTSAAATQGFAAGYQSAVNVANGTAIGYQAVANTANTISFGHVKGDTYYAADPWDHTIDTNTFDDNYYNRLVNVADGIDDHDVVVMEQLTAAKAEAVATAKNQIKVKGDEKNVHAVEATDSDGVQTTTISLLPKVTLQDSTDTTGSKALTLDGSSGTLTTGSSTLNGSGLSLTDGPSITTSGISGGSKQITSVASGASGMDTAGKAVYGTEDNAANIGDVKTIASQMVTVSKDSTKNNTKVTKTIKTDGTVDYEVALNDTLTLGDNGAVLNGTAGTLSLGTLLSMDGINGYGTIGSLHLGNYSGTDSTWSLKDNKGNAVSSGTYLTGLTNTSWTTADPTYVSGRAATEDELAAVSTTVNSGWKAQVNGTDVKTVTPTNNTLNFVAGDNIALTQDGDIQIATTPNVDFTTVRVGGTKGTDGTYTGGIYLGSQAGGGANSGTGFYITGLQNTNWDANSIVSGRAATEDQLQKAITEVQTGTLASDNYVTGGAAADDTDNPGQLKVTLNEKNGNSVNVSGLHDYYVTGGSVSTKATEAADGTPSTSATLTLTKNDNSTVAVDLSGLSSMDYHLVENSATGSDGKYSVDANGDVTLTVASSTDPTGKEITISGLASKTALEQGMTFTASALADGATSLTHTAQLGDTIGIYGGSKQDGHTYNTNNITTTISDKGDIRVLLDDNLTATSLTAGSKTTETAAGVNGMVTATGTGGAYLTMNGADGSLRVGDASGNFAAMVQNYGGPKFLNSTAAGSPRFQYWAASAGQDETTASKTLYTLATLNDGLQLSGDSGTTGSVLLDNTLTVTGGEGSSNDLSSGSNIGVTASGSTLQLYLAKNLTGLTSISLGDNLVLGNQTSGSATGDYLTGLDNTTWSGTPVSGRAATEDQLKLVSDSLSDGTKSTGGFGLTADVADSTSGSSDVKQNLGSTIKITAAGDENLTTTADTTDTAIKLALSKNLQLTSATYTDTAGNTTSVTGTGITIAKAGSTEGGRVSLTTTGLDNGGSQIVNVASGLGGTALSDATGDTLNHAATIGDLKAAAQGATDSSDAKGLNFVGNSNPSDSSSGKTTALHADLGGTVSILGTGTDEDANYSGRNVKVINKNNALYVELDKDLEARSMQVGYGESGNDIQGQLLLHGPNSDNTYSNLIVESQYMDGKPYLTNTTSTGDKRLVYKDGTDDAIHTVATMSDGLKFSDDNGSTAAVTLGSTLAVTGGAAQDKLAKDTNNKLVTGNIGVVAAENADGTSGSLTLALAKDINLGSQGSLTADSTKVGYQTATTKINQKTETGNYVTGLDNKDWDSKDYVSGRAATEDQLYQVSQSVQDTVNAATFSITAGGQGEATDATITKNVGQSIRIFGDAPKVSGGGDGDGWDRSKANILTKVKKDNKGDEYISVELQDHLEVGAHAGTDTDDTAITGVDGSMQFKGASAKEVNITGDTGIALSDNGNQTAALHQDNGAGYLDLTGTTAGTKASVSVHTGAKNLAKQDQTRLTYTDQSGKAHDVATMDDGLVVAGDNGQVTRLLNSTLKLSGGADTTKLTDKNIGVVANSSGDGLDIKLAKDLTAIDSITMTGGLTLNSANGSSTITGLTNKSVDLPDFGQVGRAATEEQLQQVKGSITDAQQGGGFGLADDKGNAVKADLGSTIGIHGDSNITTAVSEDGKSIDIKLNNQVDLGTDGSLKAGGVTISNKGIDAGSKNITNVASGIVNKDDSDNTNAANIGDVKTLAGEAAKTEIGKLGSRDFAGDDGETVSRGLGESMKLSGGADTSKLTNGNIGVVKNAAGDGLDIKLSSELTGLTSVTTGNSTLNSDGLTVNNSDGQAGTNITGSGIKIAAGGEGTHAVEVSNSNVSMGGQQIHDVAPGTAATDAVNVSQLSMFADNVGGAINQLDNRVNRVGAGAAALAALHPLDFDPDDKWDFATGFGHYKNANAAAIGAYYRPNEDTMFSIGGSFGGGENMVNAGVSFKLGQGNHVSTSRTMMAKEIESLKAVVKAQNEKLQENEDLRAKVDKQDKEIAELKAMVQQLAAKK